MLVSAFGFLFALTLHGSFQAEIDNDSADIHYGKLRTNGDRVYDQGLKDAPSDETFEMTTGYAEQMPQHDKRNVDSSRGDPNPDKNEDAEIERMLQNLPAPSPEISTWSITPSKLRCFGEKPFKWKEPAKPRAVEKKVCCRPPWERSSGHRLCKTCEKVCGEEKRMGQEGHVFADRFHRADKASDPLCQHLDSIFCCNPHQTKATHDTPGFVLEMDCRNAVKKYATGAKGGADRRRQESQIQKERVPNPSKESPEVEGSHSRINPLTKGAEQLLPGALKDH